MKRRALSATVIGGLCAGCLDFRATEGDQAAGTQNTSDQTTTDQPIDQDLTRPARSIPDGASLELKPAWEYTEQPFEAIAVGEDLLVQGTQTGIRRVTTDGNTQFRYSGLVDTEYRTSFTGGYERPVYADDSGIYFGSWGSSDATETRIHALDPETGSQQWMFEHDEGRIQQVTRRGEHVVYAINEPPDDRSTLYARDATSGEQRWDVSIEEDSITTLTSVSGRLVVQTVSGLQFRNLDSGELDTEREVNNGFASAAQRDEVLFTTDDGGETFIAVHLPSGEDRWRHESTYEVEVGPGVGATTIVYATSAGHVLARDINSGDDRWSARVPDRVANPPIVENGIVWVPSGQSALTAFNEQTGEELTHIEFEQMFASFAVQDDVLIDTVRESPYRIEVVDT